MDKRIPHWRDAEETVPEITFMSSNPVLIVDNSGRICVGTYRRNGCFYSESDRDGVLWTQKSLLHYGMRKPDLRRATHWLPLSEIPLPQGGE